MFSCQWCPSHSHRAPAGTLSSTKDPLCAQKSTLKLPQGLFYHLPFPSPLTPPAAIPLSQRTPPHIPRSERQRSQQRPTGQPGAPHSPPALRKKIHFQPGLFSGKMQLPEQRPLGWPHGGGWKGVWAARLVPPPLLISRGMHEA